MQEYFAFPEKFFFFELSDLEQPLKAITGGRAEIIFLIAPFEAEQRQQRLAVGVTSKAVLLGCSPIINLFSQTAEPIMLTQRRSEYPVVPDARRRMATEIFSVDEVVSSDPVTHELTHYEPFYSYRHRSLRREQEDLSGIPSGALPARKGDDGSEVSIIPGGSFHAHQPARCAGDHRSLHLHESRYSHPPAVRERRWRLRSRGDRIDQGRHRLAQTHPHASPPMGRDALWRLISHLALNYLSIVEEGKDALQEVLRLYNFSDSADVDKQIAGIVG